MEVLHPHCAGLDIHKDTMRSTLLSVSIDQEVDAHVEPFRTAIQIVSSIPGISDLSAEVIVSEIGIDMNRFPTEGHLISWAGLCPRNDESPTGQARGLKAHGKRRSTRMRKSLPPRRRGAPPG